MKLVNLTCPNCTGLLKKEGNNLICQSCGAAFAVDYDESDVEHEKLETEEEREARQERHAGYHPSPASLSSPELWDLGYGGCST